MTKNKIIILGQCLYRMCDLSNLLYRQQNEQGKIFEISLLPEKDLPNLQHSVMADEFLERKNLEILVTFSEHFFARIQRRIAERHISADAIQVYYVGYVGNAVELFFEPDGRLRDCPRNLFGDLLIETTERSRAYFNSKKEQHENQTINLGKIAEITDKTGKEQHEN